MSPDCQEQATQITLKNGKQVLRRHRAGPYPQDHGRYYGHDLYMPTMQYGMGFGSQGGYGGPSMPFAQHHGMHRDMMPHGHHPYRSAGHGLGLHAAHDAREKGSMKSDALMDATNTWSAPRDMQLDIFGNLDGLTGLTPRKGDALPDAGLLSPPRVQSRTPLRARDDVSSLLSSALRTCRPPDTQTPSKTMPDLFTPNRAEWPMGSPLRFTLPSDWEASPVRAPLVRAASTPMRWPAEHP